MATASTGPGSSQLAGVSNIDVRSHTQAHTHTQVYRMWPNVARHGVKCILIAICFYIYFFFFLDSVMKEGWTAIQAILHFKNKNKSKRI